MKKFIDKNDLIVAVKKNKERRNKDRQIGAVTKGYLMALDDMLDIVIPCLPTVDTVDLVRCKDCKYCEYPAPNVTKHRCTLFDRCVIADWFCAEAERKDNGNA